MAQSGGGGASRRVSQQSSIGLHPGTPPTHTHETGPLSYHWHDKQELMQRELEEARARATQMEKTMRWWSDCTANWREKWSKVRSERNKAREEVRLLRSRLEAVQRETGILRREKNDLEGQLSHISQTVFVRSHNHKEEHSPAKQQEPAVAEASTLNEQGNYNHESDSPERDDSSPTRLSKLDATFLSPEQLRLLNEADGGNLSLLEEMFGCDRGEAIGGKGVENVSVYVHSAGEASRLIEKSRSSRGIEDPMTEEYMKDSAERDLIHKLSLSPNGGRLPHRENDVEEKLQNYKILDGTSRGVHHSSVAEAAAALTGGSGSGTNSSSQPSPSHRISALSDPLPEAAHVSPRISAVSDPLSEVCGGSECSETGYAESIRSSESVIGRRWRAGGAGTSGVCSSLLDDSGITPEQESLEQQVTMLKLRLEEATKTIQAEREEKLLIDRESNRWQAEVSELRSRLEDIRASRQEAVKELVSLRALHQKEVQTLQLEMLDEASTRECIDRRLADLRGELERLQEENAAEWGRRERLDSEKLGLERENKKLRCNISDLEERLDKRTKMSTAAPDSDVATIKEELADKNKELSELKHGHAKLKKVLGDKSVELQHCNRRADQYESEVKRLRARVDELKKELAAAEDEVDCASNNIRKLQRSNDELQETVDNLQVQTQHLQSRLRSSQNASLPLRSAALLQDSDDDDQAKY